VGYKEVDAAVRPGEGVGGEVEESWPGNRSVAGLEVVTVGGGREYLVLMFGEREASGAGHAAAGRFWDDVWYVIPLFLCPFTTPKRFHSCCRCHDH
jgi:hypothetical protein